MWEALYNGAISGYVTLCVTYFLYIKDKKSKSYTELKDLISKQQGIIENLPSTKDVSGENLSKVSESLVDLNHSAYLLRNHLGDCFDDLDDVDSASIEMRDLVDSPSSYDETKMMVHIRKYFNSWQLASGSAYSTAWLLKRFGWATIIMFALLITIRFLEILFSSNASMTAIASWCSI